LRENQNICQAVNIIRNATEKLGRMRWWRERRESRSNNT